MQGDNNNQDCFRCLLSLTVIINNQDSQEELREDKRHWSGWDVCQARRNTGDDHDDDDDDEGQLLSSWS